MRLIKQFSIAILLLMSISFWSCDAINPADYGDLTDYTCEGCHTNRNALSNVIDALNLDPPDEGHAAPG